MAIGISEIRKSSSLCRPVLRWGRGRHGIPYPSCSPGDWAIDERRDVVRAHVGRLRRRTLEQFTIISAAPLRSAVPLPSSCSRRRQARYGFSSAHGPGFGFLAGSYETRSFKLIAFGCRYTTQGSLRNCPADPFLYFSFKERVVEVVRPRRRWVVDDNGGARGTCPENGGPKPHKSFPRPHENSLFCSPSSDPRAAPYSRQIKSKK
jgi:hypothetical protein